MTEVQLWRGNIVEAPAEAIVNAANSRLAEGDGVCGAIFKAAGRQELSAACDALNGCKTGSAKITPSFRLEDRGVKFIVHAVGPRWNKGDPQSNDDLLGSAYSSSLRLAEDHQVASIAIPPLSTGIFGFPKDRAAAIAVKMCRSHQGALSKIILVAYHDEDERIIKHALDS